MRIYRSSLIQLYEANKSESWLYHYQVGYSFWTTLPGGPDKKPPYNHKCKFQRFKRFGRCRSPIKMLRPEP